MTTMTTTTTMAEKAAAVDVLDTLCTGVSTPRPDMRDPHVHDHVHPDRPVCRKGTVLGEAEDLSREAYGHKRQAVHSSCGND